MKKAVIVIDMPKRCKDCFRYRADAWYGGRCTQAKEDDGWDKKIEADDEYNVQKWCPLRPYEESIPVEWIKKKSLEFLMNRNFRWATDFQEVIDMWKVENNIPLFDDELKITLEKENEKDI